jgi:hypothetical protein
MTIANKTNTYAVTSGQNSRSNRREALKAIASVAALAGTVSPYGNWLASCMR